MSSEDSTLEALDKLLNEFFSSQTSNDRKKAIEELLNNFSLQSSAWKQCVYFMNHSENIYVHMYCLTVFENVVNQKWFGLPVEDKTNIKKFLSSYLLQHHRTAPAFVTNKIIKAIVDIGRINWPHFYSDFMSNIFELIKSPSTVLVGVTMLRVTSEEFISPREDLNVARKRELQRLLLNEIPTALNLLSTLLESILQNLRKTMATLTPPPSPSFNHTPLASPFHSPQTSPPNSPQRNSTPLIKNNDLKVPFNTPSPSRNNHSNSVLHMDRQSEELCLAVLQCLSQLFSWIPLSNLLTSSLLAKVFFCAEITCSTALIGEASSSDVGVQAMSCINEIMSKTFVPAEFETFLLKMAQQSFNLLQLITKGCSGNPGDALLSRLDESYVEKFTEFMMLFVSKHLKRFEPNTRFPMNEFLQLLLKYSFHQQDVDGLFSCLDIWNSFLDYLINRLETATHNKQDRNVILSRYEESLKCLLEKIFNKISVKTNGNILESLDDDADDNETETDRGLYFNTLLETADKIAELLPRHSITKVWHSLQENISILFNLQNHIVDKHDGPHLTITSNDELQQLHLHFQDLSTFLKMMGRFSHLLIGETNFSIYFEETYGMVERLCQTAMFGAYYKTYSLVTTETLKKDINELHAQSLASLQAFCHWLAQFHFASIRQKDFAEKFNSLAVAAIEAPTCLFGKQIPDRVAISAAQLFLSTTASVRPPFLLTMEGIQNLFGQLSSGVLNGCHPKKVTVLLSRALSNALVLPWPLLPDSQQEWSMRESNHLNLISALTKDFLAIPQNVSEQQSQACKECIKQTCSLLSHIIESVASESRKCKIIMNQSTNSCVERALLLLPVYLQQSDVADAIVHLLLVSVQSLKVQLGAAFVEHIIQQLVELLSRDRVEQIINTENENGKKMIERVLKILEFIVQEPESSFKKLLPNILAFILEQVVPVIEKTVHATPDINVAVLDLLNEFLINNWRYFFKSSVVDKMAGNDVIEHEHVFASILKTFGMSFMHHDITSFRRSLEIVETMNKKFKLYNLEIFQASAMYSYLDVLLKVVLHKSHALLHDEITVAIYNMAIVNLELFFTQFLTHFLIGVDTLNDQQRSELIENVNAEKDLPSFTASINQFIGDVRYMRLINSSLPAGSVNF